MKHCRDWEYQCHFPFINSCQKKEQSFEVLCNSFDYLNHQAALKSVCLQNLHLETDYIMISSQGEALGDQKRKWGKKAF